MSRRVERGEPTGSPSAEQGFALRLDTMSESEEQQIRFWEQAKGLRDSRRFAVGYISGFHTQQTPSRIGLRLPQCNSYNIKFKRK